MIAPVRPRPLRRGLWDWCWADPENKAPPRDATPKHTNLSRIFLFRANPERNGAHRSQERGWPPHSLTVGNHFLQICSWPTVPNRT